MSSVESKRGKGFTLIELLIVITIIAILAAILFPVFARARAKARSASCQSNLKQIATALHMYTDDYDGFFPDSDPFFGAGQYNGVGCSWQWAISPYAKNRNLFICPEKSRFKLPETSQRIAALRIDVYGCCAANMGCSPGDTTNQLGYAYNASYWYNSAVRDQIPGFPGPVVPGFQGMDKTHESEIEDPARTILVSDSSINGYYQVGDESGTTNAPTTAANDPWRLSVIGKTKPANVPHTRHAEGFNMAFVDGHVKWYRRVPDCYWTVGDDCATLVGP